jgi:hypothetical protein
MRRAVKHLIGILACALIVAGVTAGPAYASAPAKPHQEGAVQPLAATSFYRLWNPTNGSDHFHTTDWNEVLTAIQLGYQYEGDRTKVSNSSGGGLVPFYRLWNPSNNDHFHTTDWNEVLTAAQLGYRYEGIRAYVYPATSSSGLPFYRLYNPTTGDHFHTTEWNEVLTAVQQGYQYEGIRARVL